MPVLPQPGVLLSRTERGLLEHLRNWQPSGLSVLLPAAPPLRLARLPDSGLVDLVVQILKVQRDGSLLVWDGTVNARLPTKCETWRFFFWNLRFSAPAIRRRTAGWH